MPNFDKLHAKQNEEVRKRWLYASPLGLAAVAFAIPLYLVGWRHAARESDVLLFALTVWASSLA